MRNLTFIPLLFIFTSCVAPNPFTITMTNESGEGLFLSLPVFGSLQLEVDGEWKHVYENPGFACMRVCGQAGPVDCILGAGDAPFLQQTYALLPGDGVSTDYDGVAYIEANELGSSCLKQVPLEGAVRVHSCRSPEALWLVDETPVELPETSGVVGAEASADDASALVDPDCSPLEFSLAPGETQVSIQLN